MSPVAGALIRVLVIDDDPGTNRMMGLSLRLQGFHVTSAYDGYSGLDEVEAHHPDVIVLDLEMPMMDGRAFFRELRARGHGTPVLIASAYGARAGALELRANGYITKPFHPDELAEKIRSIGEFDRPAASTAYNA